MPDDPTKETDHLESLTAIERIQELSLLENVGRTCRVFRDMVGNMETDLNERAMGLYMRKKFPTTFDILLGDLRRAQDTLCEYAEILDEPKTKKPNGVKK